LAGLPPGRHASSGGDIDVMPDGRLLIAGQNQLLAGASAPIGAGVANVMHFAGVDLATAVAMATTQPARLLGLNAGSLRPGDAADLVLFELVGEPPELIVRATISAGEVVFGHLNAT
jgi:N-acetylglucosamine-6-phosphate deacetylase